MAHDAPKSTTDGLDAQARVIQSAPMVDFGLDDRDHLDRAFRDAPPGAVGG